MTSVHCVSLAWKRNKTKRTAVVLFDVEGLQYERIDNYSLQWYSHLFSTGIFFVCISLFFSLPSSCFSSNRSRLSHGSQAFSHSQRLSLFSFLWYSLSWCLSLPVCLSLSSQILGFASRALIEILWNVGKMILQIVVQKPFLTWNFLIFYRSVKTKSSF